VIYRLKRLYRPEYYQGSLRRSGYFEGWYFKFVFDGAAFAVIPGVSQAADPHAFIQLIDGPTGRSTYHRFPSEAFRFGKDRFQLALGDNLFGLNVLRLRLPGLQADLAMSRTARWPSSLLAPSSMGWYAYARFMECYHGIIVLDADCEGSINGAARRGGRFYLEKDWGSSFPRAWIWMQSNSFDRPASVSFSVARVPFRGREFSGFIAGLLLDGNLHRFATYNRSRIERLAWDGAAAEVALARGGHRLELRAVRRGGAELASPVQGEMKGRIQESITSRITVRLSRGNRLLFDGTGTCAGLEVVHPEELARGELDLRQDLREDPRDQAGFRGSAGQ
jgi:tocopherol cyclase